MIRDDWQDAPSPAVSDRAERALLGALLLSPRLVDACGALRPDDFRNPARGAVYRSVDTLYQDGRPVDALLVEAELDKAGVPAPGTGWAEPLIGLLDDAGVCDEEFVASYAAIVKEASLSRRAERRLSAAR